AEEMFGVLQQVLEEYGISRGRMAAELDLMRHSSVMALRKACPDISELAEAGPIFTRLRAIKTPWEIQQLRRACAYAEAGVEYAVREIEPGVSAAGIVDAFRRSLMRNPDGSTPRFHMISVGDHFAPVQVFDTRPSQPGDVIKFDVGVEVAGYGSDIARTFVLGEPTDVTKRIYEALRRGHDRLLQTIEPGMPMKAAFQEGMSVIRAAGLSHPSETAVFEPNMVVCIETPYYGYGIGAIMIEDMLLITENGVERLNRLSTDLLLECVMLAKQLELDREFLALLMSELQRRGIELQDEDGVLHQENYQVSGSRELDAAEMYFA
ncbi:Pleckstrin y domain-containing A member 4, partial [Mortierella sp. GBA39]